MTTVRLEGDEFLCRVFGKNGSLECRLKGTVIAVSLQSASIYNISIFVRF